LVALVAVATACGDSSGAGRDTASATAPQPSTSAAMSTSTPDDSQPTEPTRTFTPVSTPAADVPEGLTSAVDIAVADLAARLSVDPSAITVVSARDVTWPDGSIGCPQPGMNYTQVQVDGAEIVLAVNGITYRYTLGGSRGPTLCTQS
jgi:hypothetical protein